MAAHTLKGALSAVGAARSADMARRLEEAGRREDLAGLGDLLDELEQEFAALRAALPHDDARP